MVRETSSRGGSGSYRLFAEQISGNAIRPRLPERKIVEQVPVASYAAKHQKSAVADDASNEPRIHTISRESYEDEG